ncbi:MAG TPA: Gfo/Idh/MocA family oxidoreductase [Candidatus Hydrogenedentes bacterium]|nr:Gfo/Idh/MocA family oxidoreductase [Candidatus Hydrogenedentota bacterium]HQM47552.1 Gfo/Idh/MocA family oxidoreductase [Candidatus Hydrogenedentota bacterium]
MRGTRINRRTFLGIAGAAAAAGLLPRTARAGISPNEKINLAVIGCGGMGSRHIEALAVNENCNLAALCDVYIPRYDAGQKMVEQLSGKKPDGYQDFRRVLERNDIDAILIASPDHWHPLLTILGCEAGKDVYVEKPACTTVEEGRAMVNAARRYGSVVQVGTQQRSMPLFQQAIDIIQSGRLGVITSGTAWIGTNGALVHESVREIPKGLDWDLWQGPAPWHDYTQERFTAFRAFLDYARGGELANWGVHLVDILHWGIRQDRPLTVQAVGGNYLGGTGADNYEVVDALLEYPGCTVTWEQHHSNTHSTKGYGMRFQGTRGRLTLDRGSFWLENLAPDSDLTAGEVVGAPELSWANPDHHNNFFECIRARKKPRADIEIGVRSTSAILLAGIALKVSRKLVWDGDAERFIGDAEANKHLTRPYRAPWRLDV